MNISSSSALYGTSTYAMQSSSMMSGKNEMATKFAEALLTSMDSDSSGSIDSVEFSDAALALSGSSDSSSIADAFSALDEDQNGALSLNELSSAMESTMSQEGTMAAGGRPPPPPRPPQESSSDSQESSYTEEELSALSDTTATTSSVLSSLYETLSNNFDAADSNADGTVSTQEAMAYQEAIKETNAGGNQKPSEGDRMKNLLAQIIASYSTQNSIASSSLNLSA